MLNRIRKTVALIPIRKLQKQAKPTLDAVRVKVLREERDEASEVTVLFCGKCGTKARDVSFCVRCGARIVVEPEQTSRFGRLLRRRTEPPKVTIRQNAVVLPKTPEPATKKRRSHVRTFIWGAITGAILLTGLVLYAAFHMLHVNVRL